MPRRTIYFFVFARSEQADANPRQDSQFGGKPSNVEPLPLFRPEAIAALQQKFYGEIILIRPFPLMLLCWFALGISAAILGFLFLGQYTEKARVPGIITVSGVLHTSGKWPPSSMCRAAGLAGYIPAPSYFCAVIPARRNLAARLELFWKSRTLLWAAELAQSKSDLAGPGNIGLQN